MVCHCSAAAAKEPRVGENTVPAAAKQCLPFCILKQAGLKE